MVAGSIRNASSVTFATNSSCRMRTQTFASRDQRCPEGASTPSCGELRPRGTPTVACVTHQQETHTDVEVQFRDLDSWESLGVYTPKSVLDIAWHPHAPRLLVVSGQDVAVVDQGGKSHGQWPFDESVVGAWNPSGEQFVLGNRLGEIHIVDAQTGSIEKSLRGHSQKVSVLAWHPDGTRLASVGADAQLLLWDAVGGALLARFDLGAQPRSVAWSPDGRRLASYTEDGRVRIWSARTPRN